MICLHVRAVIPMGARASSSSSKIGGTTTTSRDAYQDPIIPAVATPMTYHQRLRTLLLSPSLSSSSGVHLHHHSAAFVLPNGIMDIIFGYCTSFVIVLTGGYTLDNTRTSRVECTDIFVIDPFAVTMAMAEHTTTQLLPSSGKKKETYSDDDERMMQGYHWSRGWRSHWHVRIHRRWSFMVITFIPPHRIHSQPICIDCTHR